MKAIYSGISLSVVVTDNMLSTPAYKPTPPTPAKARPKMSTFIAFDAPQIADPSSKRKPEKMKSHLMLNSPYNLPLWNFEPLFNPFKRDLPKEKPRLNERSFHQTRQVDAAPRVNATDSHGNFSTLWNRSTIAG